MHHLINTDTIAAIATPPGVGGIAVVRVSGRETYQIVSQIFRSRKGIELALQTPYTMHYGHIVDPATDSIVDEVVLSLFKAPHSFTGEDSIEISCHGSQYIQSALLRLLVDNGCRLAAAGEFSQRAFLNGKMDLSQAEAVADLIHAQSAAAHTIALSQMRGGFSSLLNELRKQLLTFSSLIELELDFGDHDDLEFADRTELQKLALDIKSQITTLQASFSMGNAIKNGIPVAIVGETNAGKSTLLNLLVGDNKAIVSDIHGTTRDIIEDTVNIHGITFRFIDTAGIRNTADVVENLGIERTYQAIDRAQIILWMVDSTAVTEHIEWLADRIIKRADKKKIIIILNKTDLLSAEEIATLQNWFTPYGVQKIELSAKNNIGTVQLIESIYSAAQLPEITPSDTIITSVRHYEALSHALDSINRVIDGIDYQLSGDFIAQDIRECLFHLAEITGGQITTDEVLGNIFSHFCIGK